jgi:hypothetical protein
MKHVNWHKLHNTNTFVWDLVTAWTVPPPDMQSCWDPESSMHEDDWVVCNPSFSKDLLVGVVLWVLPFAFLTGIATQSSSSLLTSWAGGDGPGDMVLFPNLVGVFVLTCTLLEACPLPYPWSECEGDILLPKEVYFFLEWEDVGGW